MSAFLELEFRKQLIKQMRGLWLPTIHVENRLNPGVPDMSYVIPTGKHMTGWLELKAVASPADIKVESSQVDWIGRHNAYLPVHLLVLVDDIVYFIDGSWVGMMNGPGKYDALSGSIRIHENEIRSKLPTLLAHVTQR